MSAPLRTTRERPTLRAPRSGRRKAPARVLAALIGTALLVLLWDRPAGAEGSRPSLLGTVDGVLGVVDDTLEESLVAVDETIGSLNGSRPPQSPPEPTPPVATPQAPRQSPEPSPPAPTAPPDPVDHRTDPEPERSAVPESPGTSTQLGQKAVAPALSDIDLLEPLGSDRSPVPTATAHLDQLSNPLLDPTTPVIAPVLDLGAAVGEGVGRTLAVLSPVTEPLEEILNPVSEATGSLIAALDPVIDGLDPVVDRLTPLTEALAPVTEALAPVIIGAAPVVEGLRPPTVPGHPPPRAEAEPLIPPPAPPDRSDGPPGPAVAVVPGTTPLVSTASDQVDVVASSPSAHADPTAAPERPHPAASTALSAVTTDSQHRQASPSAASMPAGPPVPAGTSGSAGSPGAGAGGSDKGERTFEATIGSAPIHSRGTRGIRIEAPDSVFPDAPAARPGFAPD